MVTRLVCTAVMAITLGCGRSSRTEVVAPAPARAFPDLSTLILPTVDSATLASLDSSLSRLLDEGGLLSQLESRDSRFYGLFRDLEEAQARLNARVPSDPEGRALHDVLARMATQLDSILRSLEAVNRRPPQR